MSNIQYQDFLSKKLEDSEFAANYLLTYLEDGTPQEIADAISKILRARKNKELPKIYAQLIQDNREMLRHAGIIV
jgi:hypothetical protein